MNFIFGISYLFKNYFILLPNGGCWIAIAYNLFGNCLDISDNEKPKETRAEAAFLLRSGIWINTD